MKRILSITLALLMCHADLLADDLAVTRYFDYQRDCVQEKLHLTLDRPYYEAGDTVWFRGTLVSADNLSYMLKTNYIIVELHDKDGVLVMRRKVARAGLCFHHCLPLDAALPSGDYILSAYTSWMRNFDSEFFFKRKVHIENRLALSVAAADSVPKSLDFSVQFFPEGGQLLANVTDTQRVAFAAVGSDGYPVEVDGTLLFDADVPLSDVRSLHDGMGSFAYVVGQRPSKVRFTLRDYADANGMPLTRTFDLPHPVADTLAVTLQVVGNQVRILGTRRDSLRLIVHGGARLVSQSRVAAGQTVPLDMTTLRMGINHLVLADEKGIGMSRRLLFKCDSLPSANPIAKISDNTIENRSLVNLKLHLEDVAGHPAWGDFAVSITDGGFVSVDAFRHDGNIVSHLLMTSDLKGYIHQPGWYFTDGHVRREELDLVMLTHGWCRFATDDIGHEPALREFPHPLEQNEWLSGEVYNLKKKDLGKNLPISVYDSTGMSLGMGKIDSLGRFFIGDLHYPDEAPLEIRVLSLSKKPYYKFDEPIFPDFVFSWPMARRRTWRNVADSASSDINLLHGERVRMLNKVEVKARRRDTVVYTGGKILLQASNNASDLAKKYDLNVYNTAYDIMNRCIEEEWYTHWDFSQEPCLADTISMQHDAQPRVFIYGSLRNFAGKSLSYSDILQRIPADQVDSISITVSTGKLRMLLDESNMSYTSPAGIHRAINIYLRPNYELRFTTIDRRRRTYQTFGYTMPMEFYHPIYETEYQRKNPEPDFRKTLQWLPSVQTDREGNAEIRYYESDHTAAPRHIVVEGVTFTGKPVYLEGVIEPKK